MKNVFLVLLLTAAYQFRVSAFNVQYASPVPFEITLAGNFGEPRPNHFHGGVDIKTGGVEGKPISSIGDGYVSRLTVGLYGFGNAVYVTHPEGYTSVYCHLKRFTPRLQQLLRKYAGADAAEVGRFANPDITYDVELGPMECPVSEGQWIAVSGNTGHSQAPHLHLEIHETRTWNILDPLDFIGYLVNDSTPPQAHGLMAYPVSGLGVFNGGTGQQTFSIGASHLTYSFTAWGKVGFGLWADDYMEQTYNHYGIRETILSVDGQEVFHSVVNRIPTANTRQVNAWGDYEHWRHSNVWYMRSFVPPGVHLPLLQADEHRGIIDFCEERPYQLAYVLRDFRGNEARYDFTVVGQKQQIPQAVVRPNVRYDRASLVSLPGMQLVVPAGRLADDVRILPVVTAGSLSPCYSFSPAFPLFCPAELSIAVPSSVADASRLCIVDQNGRRLDSVCRDGWITASIRDLGGVYTLAIENDDKIKD
ncbi:MAG: M23 family metallopeptidase [Prevotella sp.]|nr:M23 family metallopeptidase [Prevotella sp.]